MARLLALSDIKVILEPEILNVQRSIFAGTSTFEEYQHLLGKLRGFEAAIKAIAEEVMSNDELEEDNY